MRFPAFSSSPACMQTIMVAWHHANSIAQTDLIRNVGHKPPPIHHRSTPVSELCLILAVAFRTMLCSSRACRLDGSFRCGRSCLRGCPSCLVSDKGATEALPVTGSAAVPLLLWVEVPALERVAEDGLFLARALAEEAAVVCLWDDAWECAASTSSSIDKLIAPIQGGPASAMSDAAGSEVMGSPSALPSPMPAFPNLPRNDLTGGGRAATTFARARATADVCRRRLIKLPGCAPSPCFSDAGTLRLGLQEQLSSDSMSGWRVMVRPFLVGLTLYMVPPAHSRTTDMLFCVSVPVLSEQMVVAQAMVSHELRWRTYTTG